MKQMGTVGLWALLALFTLTATGQTTVVINPTKDNTLYENGSGTVSNGKGISMFSGRTNQASNYLRRALLKFDVAANVPAGATITSVTLTLKVDKTGAGSQTTTLHKVTADWGEGNSNAGSTNDGDGATAQTNDATWIHRFSPATNWATPGGDFNSTSSASSSVGGAGTFPTWNSTQMIADVQDWLDNSSANFGWLVKGNESSTHTAKSFSTREATTVNDRPKLSITYTMPCVEATIASFTNSTSVCEGHTATTLQVTGSLNSATAWKLYTSSCGETLVSTNTSGLFNVTPTSLIKNHCYGKRTRQKKRNKEGSTKIPEREES